MPAEARRQVGHAFHGFEQVHLPDGMAASPCLVTIDREQEARHAIGVHQATGHDALHAFVPARPRHDERALPVVDLGRLSTRHL